MLIIVNSYIWNHWEKNTKLIEKQALEVSLFMVVLEQGNNTRLCSKFKRVLMIVLLNLFSSKKENLISMTQKLERWEDNYLHFYKELKKHYSRIKENSYKSL